MKIVVKDQMSFDSFGFRRKLHVVIREITPRVVKDPPPPPPPPPHTHTLNAVYMYIALCFKVILHQFWVKKIFPGNFNLEYGGTFTKLFMHVSSRNMFPNN